MKKQAPSLEAMEVFAKLKFTFIGIVVLAFIVWGMQDFFASFAATEVTTQTTLRTTQERDDARVLRAFAEAKRNVHVAVTLQTEPNPQQQTRDALLTVTAKSKEETLATRQAVVSAMQMAFAREGLCELYDVGNKPSVKPVQNQTYLLVKQTFRWVALAILLAGFAMLATKWKRSGLPRAALLGILAAAFSFFLLMLGRESADIWVVLIFAGPPVAMLALVFIIMRRVRRAAGWAESRARITKSKVEVERHRFAGDTTKVRNLALVEYEFDAGTGLIRNDRISLGAATADNVDEVLKRYPVGATVPVFYDPVNPQECVLERDPPASPGCIWGGTIFGVLVYEAVLLSFWNVISISAIFDAALPGIHHPLIVLISAALGLFCLAAAIWNMRHPRKALPWIRTKGVIVSSVTEAFEDSDSSSSRRMRTFYRPVIEYTYTADGQEYHGSSGSSSVTAAGGKAWADAESARYTAGMEVDVFYNPKNAAQSGLNVDTEMMLNGRASLIVAVVLLAVAVYAALH